MYQFWIVLHIVSGTVALISGMAAILMKKGSRWHKRSGRIFGYSMFAVCGAALVLHLPRGLYFLPSLAVFSFYQVYTGFRTFRIHRNGPSLPDYLMAFTGLGAAVFMILGLVSGYMGQLAMVTGIFGVFCLMLSAGDLFMYIKKKGMSNPGIHHLRRMGGGYIAAVTALLVVNMQGFGKHAEPGIVVWASWFLPSIIGTLLMIKAGYQIRKNGQ